MHTIFSSLAGSSQTTETEELNIRGIQDRFYKASCSFRGHIMPVSEDACWLLPKMLGEVGFQEFGIIAGDLSLLTLPQCICPTALLVLWVMNRLTLAIKIKLIQIIVFKEMQNRVISDLASNERNFFMICQNSALAGPTHVCRHTHSQIQPPNAETIFQENQMKRIFITRSQEWFSVG